MSSVTRRTFVKAAVGFMGGGLIHGIPFPLAPKLPEIDLSQFCCAESARYKLDVPFTQDGVTYATDARIAVRTGLMAAPPTDEQARLPNMKSLTWWDRPGDWSDWPAKDWIPDDQSAGCPMCSGKGRVGEKIIECPRCEGFGEEPIESLAEINEFELYGRRLQCKLCGKCGNIGGDECDYCDGSGQTDRPSLQRIGGLIVSGNYDRKVRTLQGVQYRVVAPDSPIVFRFNGGEGLLMPIARD